MSSAQVNPGQAMQATINTVTGGNAFQQKDVMNLAGRTAVVTGGTAGIGYEVAKSLALAGARVLVISRKAEHGDRAVEAIKQLANENPNHSGKVDVSFTDCDFGSLQNVREVADRIREQESRLDLLINNAGVGVTDYGLDSDGIERTFGVNVLGHILFTNRLLPLLRKTAQDTTTPPPRIISLTSNLHQLAPSDTKFESLSELNNPDLRPDAYYNRSKLAIILYVKKLVKVALEPFPEKIYALSVHPGAVATEIQNQWQESYGPTWGSVIQALQTPFLRAPDEGSIGTLWAAVSPDVEEKGYQGVYVTDPGKVGGETSQAKDTMLENNVWTLAHNLIKQKSGEDVLFKWNEGSKSGQ